MNKQRIRITLACTDEIRRIIENIGDGYGWPDAVSSTLRDAAEHCATGTFRLEQGVPAQELLWFPATDGMDGVSIGTLECLGDDAQEDSGSGAVGGGDPVPMGERLMACVRAAATNYAAYANDTNWRRLCEARDALTGYYAIPDGEGKVHTPGCD